MRKLFLSILITLVHCVNVDAQPDEQTSKTIDELNRVIDQAVVKRDIATLKRYYGEDFVFTHGTGLIDSKESWIKNIEKLSDQNRFISREHDSTVVELHGDIAILVGTLTVSRLNETTTTKYALRYFRIYTLRNKVWQLISHRTTREWHL
jgi:ketosteroid isomerase-like protein